MTAVTDEGGRHASRRHCCRPEHPIETSRTIRPRTVLHDDQPGPRDVPDLHACGISASPEGLDAETHARARRARDRRGSGCARARRCFARATASRRSTRSAPARARRCRCRRTGTTRSRATTWPGEIIGTDGIGADRHGCQAVALEDTEFCALPFDAHRGAEPAERARSSTICTGCCRGRSPASAR